MPQQQALQTDIILRPLAVVLVVDMVVALAMADGELFLIVVFFYPTLLTPRLCRLSPHQCRNSRSCSPLFAAARRCGCGVAVATTLAFVVTIVMAVALAVAVAIVMAVVDTSVAVAGLVSVVSAVPLVAAPTAADVVSGH